MPVFLWNRAVLGLLGCVLGARLQEVSSPAGGAARKAALEPERHLLVK